MSAHRVTGRHFNDKTKWELIGSLIVISVQGMI